ncbi:MAG: hypothetical protein FJX80_00065 [Bacteroidetes bacterium]|nr:hypothetical protein [Bacteroidota bacterium]
MRPPLKIDKKHKPLIKDFKRIINANRKIEDKLFASLISKMKLDSFQEELLFDYVYNDTRWTVQFENEK